MKRFVASLLCLCLLGCQSVIGPLDKVDHSESSATSSTTETFSFDGLSSSAWVSETFAGQHFRKITNDRLMFTAVQTHEEGGLDIGLSRNDLAAKPVSDMSPDLVFCSTYKLDLSGTGRWWAGPKISVNWQGDEAAKANGDDWYENYIVEIASSTPDELHDIFTGDYFKGDVLPETQIDGVTYKHYKIRFHSWWQFWSVRQDYRETGSLPIQPILDVWIENGLPTDRQLDGIKANIETYGDIAGEGHMRVDVTTRLTQTLVCAL
jgi:hypothetical protein